MTSAGRVLVVDDTESSRYVLSSWLRRAGYEVVEAATGEEALRSLSPDLELAVLDVNLPDMSGFDVCQAIKSDARTAAVPVLQVSGRPRSRSPTASPGWRRARTPTWWSRWNPGSSSPRSGP